MANGHGGRRVGSGRKKKEISEALIEKLYEHQDLAIKAIVDGCKQGNLKAAELLLAYIHGKPVQKNENEISGDITAIPITSWLDSKEPQI